ncbi:hypothetical protein [Sphingomonas sp. 8AM]|uniref:hypothetical protein n=1 Tax=Sphingomonas sp. 8AM TaxID=2653170 RepID=UPI0012F3BDB8|nr:hypothetical protein [Sphingomonas sp. 8AM]VXC45873.1 conserved hypothetical protein [Sphingomonas sp. 8AM]
MLILAILLQVAAPDVPERRSILAPVGDQPCVRTTERNEVVVCADPLPAQALPLPNEAESIGPRPVNRDMTGIGALRAESAPCAARLEGCQVGFNILGPAVALVRGVQKAVAPSSCCERPGEATDPLMLIGDAVKGVVKAGKHKPDWMRRVAIDLDDPVLAGRVHP